MDLIGLIYAQLPTPPTLNLQNAPPRKPSDDPSPPDEDEHLLILVAIQIMKASKTKPKMNGARKPVNMESEVKSMTCHSPQRTDA
jgi:hypothetical protein